LNADFTYVDGYDAPALAQPLNVRTSQQKLFSIFRSKKSAEPTSIQPMQTTITAGSYSGPKAQHQSSLRRNQNQPPVQHVQPGLPQLLVTAPSRPDTADFTDAELVRGGGGMWPQQNPGQPSWQTMNAVDHSQPLRYGRNGGGSQEWGTPHPQNAEFEVAFQTKSQSTLQNASPYGGWSGMQREGSPRRSPLLGAAQRSFDDHWAVDDQRTAVAMAAAAAQGGVGLERRKSLPSIVKLPAPPTPQTKQRVTTTANAVPLRRPQVDTYVIEDGVRKKVRCIYFTVFQSASFS